MSMIKALLKQMMSKTETIVTESGDLGPFGVWRTLCIYRYHYRYRH